jgi:hypothetical protein
MAQPTDFVILEQPRVHLMHMAVFTLIVAVLGAVLFPSIKEAFLANPALNGLIIVTLLAGAIYAFRMVWRLIPEVNWVNNFRLGEASDGELPILLGPMATILADASRLTVLSPSTMRSILDSLASRLDEARDLLRYLVGLLIFLGLLGTFWGLLDTVTSVGNAINALDVSSAQSASVFDELKKGLREPLEGMGLSFSSSLFGLGGSLILGFLDLKASQAQNRFYHNFEDWLSTITDIRAGDNGGGASPMPALMKLDLQSLQRSIDNLGLQLGANPRVGSGPVTGPRSDTIEELAEAVASLVQQMREEQKTVRQWIQTQQAQQSELQRTLLTMQQQRR